MCQDLFVQVFFSSKKALRLALARLMFSDDAVYDEDEACFLSKCRLQITGNTRSRQRGSQFISLQIVFVHTRTVYIRRANLIYPKEKRREFT